MSEWTVEVGDRIRHVQKSHNHDGQKRVVDYVGPDIVVFTASSPDEGRSYQIPRNLTVFYADYELAPEVFEVGKTYVHRVSGARVDCVFANDKVALIQGTGTDHHILLLPSARDNYTEVQS